METPQTSIGSQLTIDSIREAKERLKGIVIQTPLQYNKTLSRKYQCDIYLKREDLQVVRSYKLRGAYNKMVSLSDEQLKNGTVCASAGNHAQGFAYSCKVLKCQGVVFMPVITPGQKINQTKMFGEEFIEVRLTGDTFEQCAAAALEYAAAENKIYIPPFDDEKVIEGQATVGLEILEACPDPDYAFIPHGGGGLASGVGFCLKTLSPKTKLIAVEPSGAASATEAFKAGHPVTLNEVDSFVDGAAVKRIGNLTYSFCKKYIDEIHTVPEGKVCTSILKLYNEDAIVAEPAGALSIAALDDFAPQIRGKKVVCIISGGNNDIDRMQEIKERSLLYSGLKYYFLIRFPQRPGALKEFVNNVLGPNDDITRFEYIKKHNKEAGPALVGIELSGRKDYLELIQKLDFWKINYTELRKNDAAFGFLV